jgi:hypothetical protein
MCDVSKISRSMTYRYVDCTRVPGTESEQMVAYLFALAGAHYGLLTHAHGGV